jgi:hypothetical protein
MPNRRKSARFTALTLCAFALAGALGAIAPAKASTGAGTQILVSFRSGSDAYAHARAIAHAGATDVRTIPDIGVHILRVPTDQASAALTRLKDDSTVAFAELDATLEPQETLPNDPYFPQQYALGGGAWGWYQTHTTQAWDITEGSPSAIVAVLDTGLKTSGLGDFNGQVVSGWNVLSNTSDTSSQAGNHGTYVAGVVGLAGANGTGNAGFCPGCKIMPVQVGTDTGATLSNIATGLTWAADHGARVANMSWAGTNDSSTLQNAINYAHSKGLVLTAAAGNSNCNCVTYPAADTNVLGVAGTDSVGNKAGDSNYGNWVTIAAPEGNLTAWPTINGQPGYAPVGGTSLAAPVVAGIAALLFSYNSSLTNAQVEQALEASAAPVTFSVAAGRVDALAALRFVGAVDPQPASAPVLSAPAQLYYELNGTTSIAPLTSAPQPGQVLVRGVGGWTGSAGLQVTGLQWQRCSGTGTGCVAITSASTYTVLSTDLGSTIKLVFSVTNSLGGVQDSVLTAPVGSTGASAPANTALPAITGVAQAGQGLAVSTGSWSGSPTSYSYQWRRCDSIGAGCSAVSGATTSTYTVSSTDVGSTLRAAVTATNSAGSASATAAATAVVTASISSSPPSNTAAPTISGTAQAGQTLAASTGSWSGSPTSYGYQWQRCDSGGANCAPIAGATTSAYAVQSADIGAPLAVSVTATNGGGSATASSSATAPVISATAPPATTSQTFSGTLSPGNPTRSFTVTVGGGVADAQLSFTKCSSLTLGLSTGASASGPSVLVLDATLSAGTNTYTVSGGKCSFMLTVTAPSL